MTKREFNDRMDIILALWSVYSVEGLKDTEAAQRTALDKYMKSNALLRLLASDLGLNDSGESTDKAMMDRHAKVEACKDTLVEAGISLTDDMFKQLATYL